MKIKYELEGMNCGGFVNNVRRALLQIPDVTVAEVQLHPPGEVITIYKFIVIDELQTQCINAEHYTIKEVLNN